MFKNGRRYFKQVQFYSVFLSICYIAQNQCVSFHKVLQWFIFLQGLRVSKHTVFPVCKLKYKKKKNIFTQVASSLLRSRWHWRRSFRRHVCFISNGRLLPLRNECLLWDLVLFFSNCVSSHVNHTDSLWWSHRSMLSCVVWLCAENPGRAPFWPYIHPDDTTHNGQGTFLSPLALLQYCQPSEDGRQCLLISYLT